MVDLDRHGVRPDLEMACRLALGDLGVERRPFGAPFAALEAESGLLAGHAVVALDRVDRHVAGVAFLVAELVGAGLQHLEIVVARQSRPVIGAGDAHLGFGLGIVGLHLGQRDRPVEQVGAFQFAVGRKRLELVFLEAQRRSGPVGRRTADRLDDPGRQVRKILGHAPVAGGGALVLPGKLGERIPLVVDKILVFVTRAGFQDDDVDTLLGKFVAERAAAGARADDDDHAVVVQIKCCSHGFLP